MPRFFSRILKTDPAQARFPAVMAGLLTLGEPDPNTPYADWAARLRDHAADLVRMVLDDDLNQRFGMRPPLDFSKPPKPRDEPGVRLSLKCKACGRERDYVFDKVYYTRWGNMHPLEAIERYQREIGQHPDDISLRIGLGNVYKTIGRLEEAQFEYEHALALDPEAPEVWINLAQLAGLRKDIPEAIRCWERAEATLPNGDFSDLDLEDIRQSIHESLAELRAGASAGSWPCQSVISEKSWTKRTMSVWQRQEVQALPRPQRVA